MGNILFSSNISKTFNGVEILKDISFELVEGEVYAFLGRNGTGKSTLMKILSGVYEPDSGIIYFNGRKVNIRNPYDAAKMGIYMVHQDVILFETLSIAENIYFNNYPRAPFGIVDKKRVMLEAQKLCDELEFNIDCQRKVKDLSMGEKQFVALARAVSQKSKVLIMDEPTLALTMEECSKLFKIIRHLKETGISILYVTNNINEIYKIADRVSVLRDGEIVLTQNVADVKANELVYNMVGRDVKKRYPKLPISKGKEIFRVEGISRGNMFHDISFNLRRGEILGITGLIGSGRTAIAKTIFGEFIGYKGDIYLRDTKANIRSPMDAVKQGICYIPEDRMMQGLLQYSSIKENVSIANLGGVENEKVRWMINRKIEKKRVTEYIDRLAVRCLGIDQSVRDLSGGNQQKVLIARWLIANSTVLILDEPTKGLDIVSKVEVYNIMNELAREGKGIIFISSDFSEVIGMCDRILVMASGRISKIFNRDEATKEMILRYASASN